MKKSIVFFLSVIMIMLSCSNNIYAENVKYGANDIVYEQNYVFSDGRLTDVKDENGIVIEHNEYENGMRVYKEGNSICQFVYDSKKTCYTKIEMELKFNIFMIIMNKGNII